MKKQITKITLKTDKIVSLSKDQAQNVVGGMAKRTDNSCTECSARPYYCPTGI